jgi:hypothetical protein
VRPATQPQEHQPKVRLRALHRQNGGKQVISTPRGPDGGVTHYALITSLDHSTIQIAGGNLEWCRKALKEWVAKNELDEFDVCEVVKRVVVLDTSEEIDEDRLAGREPR